MIAIWNEIELFRIKMTEKEFSRSVTIRNVLPSIDKTQFGTHPTPRGSATWPVEAGKTTFETMGVTSCITTPKRIEK